MAVDNVVMKGGNVAMWRFKSCTRCNGDMFLNKDTEGWHEQCLQCGYIHYLDSMFDMEKGANDRLRKPALTGSGKRFS